MDLSLPLHFVFLGERLPSYVPAAIRLAKKYSGMPVKLIGSARLTKSLGSLADALLPLEDFYDPAAFENAVPYIGAPHAFRSGFFLKSLERFFVLEQVMKFGRFNEIFHAELDQILFRTDKLAQHLSTLRKDGLYLPFHNERFAIASIFYCRGVSSLTSFLDLAGSGTRFEYEMELLSTWSKLNQHRSFSLPTIADRLLDNGPGRVAGQPLSIADVGGIVDAAQLGQWIAGIDPRNVPRGSRPKTRFVDPPERHLVSRDQLEGLEFIYDDEEGTLLCRVPDGSSIGLFNLHIHSKAHKVFESTGQNPAYLLFLANAREAQEIPGMRHMQLLELSRVFVDKVRSPRQITRAAMRRISRPHL